jgi:hypothetical protein
MRKTLTIIGDSPLQSGDIISIAGVYRSRTFWQWLINKPKHLQQFMVNRDIAENQFKCGQFEQRWNAVNLGIEKDQFEFTPGGGGSAKWPQVEAPFAGNQKEQP